LCRSFQRAAQIDKRTQLKCIHPSTTHIFPTSSKHAPLMRYLLLNSVRSNSKIVIHELGMYMAEDLFCCT
jgi:hypothetical protein